MALNIWIVSLFEPTPVDNTRPMRYMGIAEAAVKKGHHITHFSCTYRHSTKIQRFASDHSEKINELYDLIFVFAKPYSSNISVQRMRSHRQFTANLMKLVDGMPKPDLLLVAFPPMTPAVALTQWGKKLGIPVYIDIIDPWPDVFLRLAPKKLRSATKVMLEPMYRQLRKILTNTSGIIAISEEYIQWAKSYNIPVKRSGAFLPAVPFEEVQLKIKSYLHESPRFYDGVVQIIYAGNLGVAYDIPSILEAARLLEEKYPGKTKFVIAGMGYYVKAVQDYATRHKNLLYLGRIGYDDLIKQYAKSDLGLAQYSKGATQSITYKFFDYLSAGLPILNSLMSEMSTLISNEHLGFNNMPGDYQKLVENIELCLHDSGMLDDYKKNAVDFTSRNGDNEVVYSRLVDFIVN